jgi:glycine/D-amino acid oxidase-like deaminating enzyme
MKPFPHLDAIIVGGGIAGLWIANRLLAADRQVLVLEADELGCQQTLASQGMIHGGLKYALGGGLTGASEAIASMPARWRACLDGSGELDLQGLTPLSDDNLLFANGSGLDRFTAFFASRALRGRIQRLAPEHWPEALRGCAGWVYALNDLVLDTPALVEKLAAGLAGRLYRHRLMASEIRRTASGWALNLAGETVSSRELVLCAGEGNEALLRGLAVDSAPMQRRPLRQIILRGQQLKPLYGHCLTGIRSAEPRLTITSHPDGDGWIWYLGGQLAGAHTDLSEPALCELARAELDICLPWIDFTATELYVLDINRAEVASDGKRPDEPFVQRTTTYSNRTEGPIVCWPTKLTLAPIAADQVIELMTAGYSTAREPTLSPKPALDLTLPIARSGKPRWQQNSGRQP